MEAKKTTYVFYIEKNLAYLYGTNFSSILKLDFPSDIFSDLEVLSREKLSIFIQTFLESNNFPSGNILILLSSNVTFEKDFTGNVLSQEFDRQVGDFLNYVPFENILSRTFKLGDKIKVVAANKEFCDVVKSSFEKQKFFVLGVVPISLLQNIMPELTQALNLQLVLTKCESAREFSLYSIEEIKSKNPNPKVKKEQKNLYYLLMAFGFLFLIMIIVILKAN